MKILVTSPSPCKLKSYRIRHRLPRAKGFSLLEVLISIVILSFGLLGMVGLQAAALQANRDSRLQSVATTLAREMAEMMRGNKDVGRLNTVAANTYLGQFSNPTGTTPLAPTTVSFCLNVGALPCTSKTAIAQAQMTEWLTRVDAQLPGAHVEICLDDQPFDTNGLPQWNCPSSVTGGTIMIKIGWTRNSTNRSNTGAQVLEKAIRPSVIFPITAGAV